VSEVLPLVIGKSSREIDQELERRERDGGEGGQAGQGKSRMTLHLSARAIELLDQARDLDAHPGASAEDVLEKALELYVAEKRRKKTASLKRPPAQPAIPTQSLTFTAGAGVIGPAHPPVSRHIPRPIRRFIWQRDQGKCQYRDSQTNHRCHSTRSLTVEHHDPYALGGSHDAVNLSLYCAAHNTHENRKRFK
jgi:hypothetical protein